MTSFLMGWFWFLLPLAALSGWYFGTRENENNTWTKTPEYIAGLNYLLNQQTTKAIDTLIKFFKVNLTTVDTHIILGNLFREKGELEKAIKIHHNVVSRDNISGETRVMAMLELGRDYFSSGLLDNAEEIFLKLTQCDSRSAVREAHISLVTIYEREKSWEKAIKCAGYLMNSGDQEYRLRITHYHCEQVDQLLAKHDYKQAKKSVANLHSAGNVRAAILEGDAEFVCGHHSIAMHLYSNVFTRWPAYAQIVLPKLKACFPPHSMGEFANHLHKLTPSVMTVSYIMSYTRALLGSHRPEEAEAFALNLIKSQCVPVSMLRLFIENSIKREQSDEKELMPHFVEALRQHEEATGFSCSECGFETAHLYWQCPSCHSWQTACSLDIVESAKDASLQ